MKNRSNNNILYLVLLSLLAMVALAARVYHTHSFKFLFLVWNLALAWTAVFFSSLCSRSYNSQSLQLLFYGLWLLFFPNTLYIITDFIHLRSDYSFQSWIDLIVLLLFSCCGFWIGLVSLAQIQSTLQNNTITQRWTGWHLIVVSIATGYGIYLGRFLRFNSWDFFHQPLSILAVTLERILHPLSHPRTCFVTVVFAVLLYFSFLLFYKKEETHSR